MLSLQSNKKNYTCELIHTYAKLHTNVSSYSKVSFLAMSGKPALSAASFRLSSVAKSLLPLASSGAQCIQVDSTSSR